MYGNGYIYYLTTYIIVLNHVDINQLTVQFELPLVCMTHVQSINKCSI